MSSICQLAKDVILSEDYLVINKELESYNLLSHGTSTDHRSHKMDMPESQKILNFQGRANYDELRGTSSHLPNFWSD